MSAIPAAPAHVAWRTALVASVVLVAYGNVAWQPGVWSALLALTHPLLVVAALAWALGPARLTWGDLGLGRAGWGRGTLLGLALGTLMALAVGGLLLGARAIGWGSSTAVPMPADAPDFALRLLRLLVATALCEEIWFRGVLQACWVRLLGPGRGIVVTAALFAAWHLAIWAWTLDQVTLTPALPFALTYPAGLLILGIAGLLFGWLRQATGHLAGPVVAHWAIDVALVILVSSGWL